MTEVTRERMEAAAARITKEGFGRGSGWAHEKMHESLQKLIVDEMLAALAASVAEPDGTPLELTKGQFDFCMEGYDAADTTRETVRQRVNAAIALLATRAVAEPDQWTRFISDGSESLRKWRCPCGWVGSDMYSHPYCKEFPARAVAEKAPAPRKSRADEIRLEEANRWFTNWNVDESIRSFEPWAKTRIAELERAALAPRETDGKLTKEGV